MSGNGDSGGITGGSGGINLFEAEGITGLPEFLVTLPGGKVLSFNDWLYYLTWTIALVLFAVAWGIHHSRFGRSLRAIRDNEIAAAASGVWLASHKTLAFSILMNGVGYNYELVRPEEKLIANQPATRLHSQLDFGAYSQSRKIAGREAVRLNPVDAAHRGIAARSHQPDDTAAAADDAAAVLSASVLSVLAAAPSGSSAVNRRS
jgi:hypothetical protein